MNKIKLFEQFNEGLSDREQRQKDNEAKAKEVMKVATPEQKKVLDDFQSGTEFFFLMPLKLGEITPEAIDYQLMAMVNSVEGDTSQLDDEHAKYAKSKGWLESLCEAAKEPKTVAVHFNHVYSPKLMAFTDAKNNKLEQGDKVYVSGKIYTWDGFSKPQKRPAVKITHTLIDDQGRKIKWTTGSNSTVLKIVTK